MSILSDTTKVLSVIKSCQTNDHFDSAKKMIENFSIKWKTYHSTHSFLLGFLWAWREKTIKNDE